MGAWDEFAEEGRYDAVFCGSGAKDLGLLMGHHPVKEWREGLVAASDFDGDEHAAAEEGGGGADAFETVACCIA